jgi:acetyl/propionyl-CoA carboxylase alpha subunit
VAGDWLQAVRQVVAAVCASDVTELEVANGDFSVRVRRDPEALLALGEGARIPFGEDQDTHLHRVVAPFTGVFYRSPTPDAGAYVGEGDWVDADGVIGLVETMKIFNEVTADVAGRIKKMVADNGQLVHTGDTLVLLEPGERATAEPEPRI